MVVQLTLQNSAFILVSYHSHRSHDPRSIAKNDPASILFADDATGWQFTPSKILYIDRCVPERGPEAWCLPVSGSL
jgi:hypothetical protein